MKTALTGRTLIIFSLLQLFGAFCILSQALLSFYVFFIVVLLVLLYLDFRTLPDKYSLEVEAAFDSTAELEKDITIYYFIKVPREFYARIKNASLLEISSDSVVLKSSLVQEVKSQKHHFVFEFRQVYIPQRVTKFSLHEISIKVGSLFSMFSRTLSLTFSEKEILIQPSKAQIPQKVYQSIVRDQRLLIQGAQLIKRSRAADQFHSLRPYRFPDSVRHIDNKKSAKFGSLMTKTYESIHKHNLIICLDIGRVMFGFVNKSRKLDYYLSACRNLAEFAIKNGDSVSFLAFTQSPHARVINSKNIREIRNSINSVAMVGSIETDSDYSLVPKLLPLYKMSRSIVVVLSDVSQAHVRVSIENLMSGLCRKHSTVTLSLIERAFEIDSKVLSHDEEELSDANVAEFIYASWIGEQIKLFNLKLSRLGCSSVVIPDAYWISACEKVYSSLRV